MKEQREFFDHQRTIQYSLRDQVAALHEDTVRGSSVDQLVEPLLQDVWLPQIEKDPDRGVEVERRLMKGTPDFDVFDVFFPVLRRTNLTLLLSLRPLPANTGPFDFGYNDGNITFTSSVEAGQLDKRLAQLEKEIIQSRNRKADEFNKALKPYLRPLVEARKKHVEAKDAKYKESIKSISYPITIRGDEKSKIVELTTVRPVPAPQRAAPSPSPSKPAPPLTNWILKNDDLTSILEIVGLSCRQFELTPLTFLKLLEEDLRNIILANLNAVFKGAATGETFIKRGKSDIRLEAEGGGLFVAECKFWDGIKQYSDTIQQLFRYLTWRETYGVVITFDKSKEMTANIAKVFEHLGEYKTEVVSVTASHMVTVSKHPEDAGRTVTIHHLFFHLAEK